jgi:hypothetical protein
MQGLGAGQLCSSVGTEPRREAGRSRASEGLLGSLFYNRRTISGYSIPITAVLAQPNSPYPKNATGLFHSGHTLLESGAPSVISFRIAVDHAWLAGEGELARVYFVALNALWP